MLVETVPSKCGGLAISLISNKLLKVSYSVCGVRACTKPGQGSGGRLYWDRAYAEREVRLNLTEDGNIACEGARKQAP